MIDSKLTSPFIASAAAGGRARWPRRSTATATGGLPGEAAGPGMAACAGLLVHIRSDAGLLDTQNHPLSLVDVCRRSRGGGGQNDDDDVIGGLLGWV